MNTIPNDPDDLTLALAVEFNGYTVVSGRCSRCQCVRDVPVLFVETRWIRPAWTCYTCVCLLHPFRGKAWADVLNVFCKAKRVFYERERWIEKIDRMVRV